MREVIDTSKWKSVPAVFEGFKFLTKPITNLKSNIDLDHIVRNKEGIWEATDGNRIHTLALDDFGETGFYNILTKTKAQVILQKVAELDEIRWPDTEATWPEHKNYETGTGTNLTTLYTATIRALQKEGTLNINYIEDLTDTDNFWTFYVYSGHLQPVVFESDNKMALVALIRI